MTILHLDDHWIFKKAIKGLLTNSINDVAYLSYELPIVALKDIQAGLESGNPVDLVITDFNHFGISGYQFACEIRKIEQHFDFRIPILLLTMMQPHTPDIKAGIVEKVFDAYFTKAVESDVFLKAVRKLLFGDERARESGQRR
jgi:response regulator RpfG family c-di-GMP phosphodiesterase